MNANDDWVTIATVNGPIEEMQIRSFLESNDIAVRVRGEAIRKTHGITVDGIGAAHIEVRAAAAAQARELLAQADRGELELAEDADPPE